MIITIYLLYEIGFTFFVEILHSCIKAYLILNRVKYVWVHPIVWMYFGFDFVIQSSSKDCAIDLGMYGIDPV